MINEKESITAKICAYSRAWHSLHSHERIYDDYLAFDIMGREEYEEISELIRSGLNGITPGETNDVGKTVEKYFAPITLSRLHFCENKLGKFAEKHGSIQYVICGAGEDTFAFRNENDNIEIFEVDHPNTQRFKLARIRELEWIVRPNVHFVSVDFEKERMTDKLLQAGFDPKKNTFFSILGVSYYLTFDNFVDTLRELTELCEAESKVVFDHPVRTGDFPRRVSKLEEIANSLGETMCGGFDHNEMKCVLCSLGYRLDSYLTPDQIQEKYFEGRSDDMRAFENVCLTCATVPPKAG